MERKRYVFWQEDETWLGYLEEYPDYWTQGETQEELKENLVHIYKYVAGETVPNVRRVAELEVA
jgi:pyruvoyl-dependent arginine decarboxylase (PvlArgDC)